MAADLLKGLRKDISLKDVYVELSSVRKNRKGNVIMELKCGKAETLLMVINTQATRKVTVRVSWVARDSETEKRILHIDVVRGRDAQELFNATAAELHSDLLMVAEPNRAMVSGQEWITNIRRDSAVRITEKYKDCSVIHVSATMQSYELISPNAAKVGRTVAALIFPANDPQFIVSLKSNIQGIFLSQVVEEANASTFVDRTFSLTELTNRTPPSKIDIDAKIKPKVPAYFEDWRYVKMMDETLWLKKDVISHEYFYEPKIKSIKPLHTKYLGV
ncbi:unnamed protein product [Callosobruchus maculatus]|uniref:Uncharacterized protein n=1 Tax=Callosobruchus maculatus TaxID=64391 RepID=A0A653C3G8_CALMS|nr:unnamed protein product [Callosobruchus maculatus]